MTKLSLRKTIIFLILTFILIFSVTYHLEKVYAIDEVIDDYTDETNVAGKHQVLRNTTYDAMELEYVGVEKDYENFNTYTEVDVPGDLITITAPKVAWNAQTRIGDTRAYKDYGAGYFGDFSIEFEMEYTNVEAGDASGAMINTPFVISNSNGDWDAIWASQSVLIYVDQDGATDDRIRYFIYARSGGGTTGSDVDIYRAIAKYYCRITRTGASLNCKFYSDSERTALVFQLTCACTETTLRYLQIGVSRNNPDDGSDHSTGYISYMWDGVYGEGYLSDGHFYTTDLLSGISYGSVAMLLNSTIPEDDSITVEFSQDNSTWALNDWEPIFGGYEAIDLRELGYSTIYCRFNFTDGGADSTPRLYQLRLIHSAPGPGTACVGRTFNASSIAMINGTLNDGQLNSTYWVDGDWYNVSEIVGPPGLDVRFNFTGLQPGCGCLEVYHTYTGKAPHHLEIQVWNFTSLSWNQIGTIIYNETLGWECSGLGGRPLHFFSGGELWARFYHEDRGHVPHELQVNRIDLRLVQLTACPPVDGVAEPDYVPYIALGIILLLFGLIIGSRLKR